MLLVCATLTCLSALSTCRKGHDRSLHPKQNGLLADNRRMMAGFAAGVTEALVIVTPFEVVKIRLQQQRGMAKEMLKYRVCAFRSACYLSFPARACSV